MSSKFLKLIKTIEVIEVPSGKKSLYPKDTEFRISQIQGDEITIVTKYGTMARINPENRSALGPQGEAAIAFSKTEDERILQLNSVEEQIDESLKRVHDPEIPLNILDLGLVYKVEKNKINEKYEVVITMTLTSPTCALGDVIKKDVEKKIAFLPNVSSVKVDIVFTPQWNRSMMSTAAKLELGML